MEKMISRTDHFFSMQRDLMYQRTDRLFAGLMLLQWIGAVIAAYVISPSAWEGTSHSVHMHVWAALFLGGFITLIPVYFARFRPGATFTRHTIAVSQMLMSALLIHLTGGRIETHFHVFGSLAFLAFYRDWRVLVTATAIVTADHYIRGVYMPQSVFGVLAASSWRWMEHAFWVVFEDIFLMLSISQSLKEMHDVAARQATLEDLNLSVEAKITDLTRITWQLQGEIGIRKKTEAALAQARDVALQSVRLKSEFMANMSHEIRTPMNAIVGMAELLLETDLNPKQKEFVDIFQRSGDHLLTLINDILDFSKAESGALQLEQIDFDLRDLMENTLTLLMVRAEKKGLRLNYDIAPDVPLFLSGDPNRLRQIITNIIGNAIKFTEKGNVLLHIQNEVQVETGLPYHLRFSVTDTGIGIAADKLDAIFESFVQGDSSITRKYGGSGLGLTISKKLVVLMGGHISVSSELGKGSHFVFIVPFKTPKEPPSRLAAPSTRSLKGVKTLIVDDNSANRFLAGLLLSAQGLLIVERESVHQGIEEIERSLNTGNPYQLLLVDLHMQGANGFELVKYLRAHKTDIAIVMLSSSDPDSSQLARCRRLAIAPPLVKPVKTEKLIETIRYVLDHPKKTGRPLHILLVEDSPDNQMLMLTHLKKTSHYVDLADNGEIAVKKATEGSYDLILMDMQMPVMDGYSATRAIREWETRNGKKSNATPIIALTAYALKEEIEKSFQAGCTGHMSKPIKKVILMDVLEQYAREDSLAA